MHSPGPVNGVFNNTTDSAFLVPLFLDALGLDPNAWGSPFERPQHWVERMRTVFHRQGITPTPPRVVLSGSYVTPHSQNFLLNTINNVLFQHLEQFMTHTKLRLWPTDLLTPLPTS
jgi:hypothetical protein